MKYEMGENKMNFLNKVRKEYTSFLEDWKWDLHATISYGRKIPYSLAFQYAKQWFHKIKQEYSNIKFAGIMLLSNPNNENPHIHNLLISDPSYDKTFRNLPDSNLEKLRKLCKENCIITTHKEWENSTIAYYLSKERNLHLFNPDQGDINVFRPKLLNKLKF